MYDQLGHQSLKDLVLNRLRKQILDGHLEFGTRLTETAIAKELGVSRGPVREAIQDLSREGLLIISPRRGVSVSTLAPDEMWEIYALRGYLESLLVRHGLRHMTEEDMDYLQKIIAEMASLKEGPGAVVKATELDLAFHGRIADRCPHPRMRDAYRQMDGMIGAGIYTVGKVLADSITGMADKHQPVLEALRSGNTPIVEEAVRSHWITTAERIRRAAENRKKDLL
jgi:DNA-binding GntR family transcriptional regulator